MALRLEPLHPLFAARASGVELARPLDPGTVAEIDAAMDRYALLVFHDQPLSQAEQVALARQFGPLDAGLRKRPARRRASSTRLAQAAATVRSMILTKSS